MTTRTSIITNKNGNPPGPVSNKPPGATLSSLLMKVGPRLLLLIVLVVSA